MNREEFAQKILWSFWFWVIGFVNVSAMLPQLGKILSTWRVDDLALPMYIIYLVCQLAFGVEGFFKRNTTLMVVMGLSALVNAFIIALVLYIR